MLKAIKSYFFTKEYIRRYNTVGFGFTLSSMSLYQIRTTICKSEIKSKYVISASGISKEINRMSKRSSKAIIVAMVTV